MTQDLQYIVVLRRLPLDATPGRTLAHDRQLQFSILYPQQYLTGAAQLSELAQY